MFSFLPTQPKIIKKEGNKVVFEIEGLYPGYGTTIGNSLRRVLLSSIPGAAVTQVKIKGVSHEFSTISGVLEDVISILLNIKQLTFKIFTDEPQKARLLVKGEKEVKAFDIQLPPQIELVNENVHIATLTDKRVELDIEMQIRRGIGYEPIEKRKKEKLEIGAIAVDAIFTPVKRVTFRTENMMVGERIDFDRLFLEIETDGSISPEKAFAESSEILVNHFSLFIESYSSLEASETKKKSKEKKSESKSSQKIILTKRKHLKSKTSKKT